jgi:nitrite reductase/ring-hydroxylating ferredoxin subunit
MSGDRIEVTTEDELTAADGPVVVDVRGVEIAIREIDGSYYALGNVCPHQYGPAGEGIVKRPITADVPDCGERPEQRYEDCKVVRCPWHGWGFDIETGENMAGPNSPGIPTYDVVVEDGIIYIQP